VKKASLDLGLPIAQIENTNSPEGIDILKRAAPQVSVVASYGQLLKREVFLLPEHGTINIHASLLPRYRGPAPINWAIIRGESQTGVTTFFIEQGMDTGDILLQRSCPIEPNETAGQLHDRLAAIGAEAILETLQMVESGKTNPTPQKDEEATIAPKLSRSDGRIAWQDKACDIHNLVRGLNPWPGAYTHLGNEAVKIHKTLLTQLGCGSLSPGTIALRKSGRLLVATGKNLIEILEIQRENRATTSGKAFLNGLRADSAFS
jgi:methionyl-tRNA formyltransferase